MSENAAERKRRTNQLVRMAADYIFKQKTVTPEQIYGLCKLTSITSGKGDSYIKSTKIPAISYIFGKKFPKKKLDEVANEISTNFENPTQAVELICSPTGFVNSYNAFRNSSLPWIKENHKVLLPLFKEAYSLSSDEQGLKLIKKIVELPTIPKANNQKGSLRPEFYITPVFFALDSRVRFPIINGNKEVVNLLLMLKVSDKSLEKQYQEMIKCYGKGGINDAADLDSVGKYLVDIVGINGNLPTKMLLQDKPTTSGSELPLKDESDLISLQDARTVISKRIHNKLTNDLKKCLGNYKLTEGTKDNAFYDVLVENYDRNEIRGDADKKKGNDLLIEVKSSSEAAHIRMAIGQLYDYWFRVNKGFKPQHLAILIPNEPDNETKSLLKWLGIGMLWFSGDKLETCCKRLNCLIENQRSENLNVAGETGSPFRQSLPK